MEFRWSKTGLSTVSPSSFFSTDRFKAVPLLQFIFDRGSVFSYVTSFCHCLFLISPFGASGRRCFLTMAFLGIFNYSFVIRNSLIAFRTESSFVVKGPG